MINTNYSLSNFQRATKPLNPAKLQIYYYNDTHGNSDQMAGVINGAKQFRQDSLNKDSVNFVLSAGDNFSGADVKKNDFIVDLMQDMIGVDLSAVGNHEIDGGSDGFFEVAKNRKLQFIASNVILSNDNPAKDVIKKSTIKEQNGIKYGFIGTMPIDFEKVSKTENQKGLKVMDFNGTVKALQNEINNLKQQGINKIILLSHSGYEIDRKYAQSLDGVDIIVGGHTHTVVSGAVPGENILKSKSNEPVLVVQAGENGKYYGIIDAEFDNKGVLKSVGNSLIESPNKKKSPIIEHVKVKNLGVSPKVATLTKVDPMPKNRRVAPCAWTSVVADSMKNELGGDIALINAANIRKVPQAGTVTERDVMESAPMKNKLLKTKVTQKQVIDAIKNASKKTMGDVEGVPGLLITSGLEYKIDDKGNLLSATFVDNQGKKTPIDVNNPSDSISYTAIYDNFVAKENGEYPELFPRFAVEQFEFDKDSTMIKHLSKFANKDNLEITDDKRIEILKTSQQKPQGSNSQSFLGLTCPKVS